MFYTERDLNIPLTLSDNLDAVTAQDIRFTLTKGGTLVVDKRKTTGGITVTDSQNATVLITETDITESGTYKIEAYLIDQLGDIRPLTPTSLTTTDGDSTDLSTTNPTVCFIKSLYTE